ncbi:hypothetical protein PspLS_02887 [Pyricularia sp. CBS 133598]|nr:hypothetical protein PspLS_02887 [Pyricularia sp. CBS 133598]
MTCMDTYWPSTIQYSFHCHLEIQNGSNSKCRNNQQEQPDISTTFLGIISKAAEFITISPPLDLQVECSSNLDKEKQ